MRRFLKRRKVQLIGMACACWFVGGFYGARDFSGFASFMFATTGGSIMVAAMSPRRITRAEEERSIRFLLKRALRKGNSEFRYCTNIRDAYRLGAAMQRRAVRLSFRAD